MACSGFLKQRVWASGAQPSEAIGCLVSEVSKSKA